jgi:hypothetical protein
VWSTHRMVDSGCVRVWEVCVCVCGGGGVTAGAEASEVVEPLQPLFFTKTTWSAERSFIHMHRRISTKTLARAKLTKTATREYMCALLCVSCLAHDQRSCSKIGADRFAVHPLLCVTPPSHSALFWQRPRPFHSARTRDATRDLTGVTPEPGRLPCHLPCASCIIQGA